MTHSLIMGAVSNATGKNKIILNMNVLGHEVKSLYDCMSVDNSIRCNYIDCHAVGVNLWACTARALSSKKSLAVFKLWKKSYCHIWTDQFRQRCFSSASHIIHSCRIRSFMGCDLKPGWMRWRSDDLFQSVVIVEYDVANRLHLSTLFSNELHLSISLSISQSYFGCFYLSLFSLTLFYLRLLWGASVNKLSSSPPPRWLWWLWNPCFLFHWWWCLYGLYAIF